MNFMYQVSLKMKQAYPSLVPIYPPLSVLQENNNQSLVKYVKEGVSMTDHYSGTCSITDVIDPVDFSLFGNNKIHVVDASVFPAIPDGNTEFATRIIAEIGADRITNSLLSS